LPNGIQMNRSAVTLWDQAGGAWVP